MKVRQCTDIVGHIRIEYNALGLRGVALSVAQKGIGIIVMARALQPDEEVLERIIHFHHGTDETSANDLLQNGVDHQHAAAWNGSGEFWTTSDHRRAEWFARSHPLSPPAACFEFDLPEAVLQDILQTSPPAAKRHGTDDYEFLPASHALLNQHMTNKRVVPVP